ncbi:LysM domain-containing protein [Colletotrichum plurivorum]|uniref:LysM domain-containing protein n=1 Tax=Colletotrichum plurivorum TaxID=2175906 RepID=A0A8H6N286_9PEZI|nr:LysM domain-containing protein [Colletotrichum plurivorum]
MPGEWGISIENFLKWNPSLTPDCGNYLNGLAYCVEAPAGSPTTTSSAPSGTTSAPPGNGIETPQPIQPGMVSNCSKFYFVKTDESCASIAAANGISEAQFLSWNPAVGENCRGMWAATYVCVRTLDFAAPTAATTPASTASPTTTKPANGIVTPQPTQPGVISNCDKFYFVKTDEPCTSIAASHGISMAQFLAWNPMAGSNCAGLWANAYACVHAIGSGRPPTTTVKPPSTTTAAGNGVATPSPTQLGMVGNCDRFHFVKADEFCADIAAKYGISSQQIIQWNSSVGSSCAGLWANVYICVHTR